MFFSQNRKIKTALFFDVDGVLNRSSQWREERFALDATLVENLALVAKRTGCDLILASSWRTGFVSSHSKKNLPHIVKLENALMKYDISITGATPVLRGHSREEEITAYLKYHDYDTFVIVDDDPEEYCIIPSQIVFTDSRSGLTKEKASEISRTLFSFLKR